MKDAIRVFTVVLIFGVIAPGQYADLNKAADTAVILAYTSGADRKQIRSRYKFILPRMVKRCTDIGGPMKVIDMLAMSHKMLSDAGLGSDEKFLNLSNALHSMVSEVYDRTGSRALKCSAQFAMYVMLRQNGKSQEEARKAVEEISVAILRAQ